MLPTIDKQLGTLMTYTKFRVSNNNNSTDAGTFHRDLITIKPGLKEKNDTTQCVPIFTCLAYLDKTVMEIIPGTHLKPAMNLSESVSQFFSNTLLLEMHPGDLLVFYSTLLHRGIFTEKLENRRLIQVFETYPSQEAYNVYADKVLHIPAEENKVNTMVANSMVKLSRSKLGTNFANALGYLNASTGYGHSSSASGGGDDEDKDKLFTYISSEAKQKRIIVDPNVDAWQDINVYIITKDDVKDIDPLDKKSLYHKQYTRQIIIYLLLLFLFLSLLCLLFYTLTTKIYHHVKKNDDNYQHQLIFSNPEKNKFQ
jgi:hypothetical protein